MTVSSRCICTAIDAKVLAKIIERHVEGATYIDSHPWIVAQELLHEVTSAEQRLPLMFATGDPVAFSHWTFVDAIDVREWAERRRRSLTNVGDRVVSHVAEVEREIVGWAVGGPNRDADSTYAGELYAIYLLFDFQRRGIGRRLAAATAESLVESGFGSMLVWVLVENRSARRFYEALGAEYVQERQIAIGGASLREAAYGWEDLDRLVTVRG